VSRTPRTDRKGRPQEIIMEMNFEWKGDQEMEIIVKPLPRKLGPATFVLQGLSTFVKLRVQPLPSLQHFILAPQPCHILAHKPCELSYLAGTNGNTYTGYRTLQELSDLASTVTYGIIRRGGVSTRTLFWVGLLTFKCCNAFRACCPALHYPTYTNNRWTHVTWWDHPLLSLLLREVPLLP
jgi:hypothetical protein